MTKGALVSDIILRVTRGKPSDDLELEPRQVAYWMDMFLAALIKSSLDAKLADKGVSAIDPSYICWEKELQLSSQQLSTLPRYDFFIDLCNTPINLTRDRGIMRVSTSDGDWVDKMKMEEIDNILKLKYSSPSLKNLKYTRVKNRIYVYGVTIDTYLFTKFDIAYIPAPQLLTELSDGDEIWIGEDLLPKIAEEVEKLARRQMASDEDLQNDGQQGLKVNGQ